MDKKNNSEDLRAIPPHGGYKDLVAFQMVEIVFDGTIRFCDRFVNAAPSEPITVASFSSKECSHCSELYDTMHWSRGRRSRTHDQMVQVIPRANQRRH
jgi:hypothetical protein